MIINVEAGYNYMYHNNIISYNTLKLIYMCEKSEIKNIITI